MNIQEIYELGLAQGWDEADAFYLATIAWAESKGDPMAMEFIEENPLESQYSFGIWQINLQHVPHLMAAGIGDWTSNTGGDLSDPELEAAINDPDSHANIINHIREVLSDPVTNAEAAEYVGHRRDYSEPLDDWDWTRWSVTELPINDENHPGKYGGDVTRRVGDEPPDVPDDFNSRITGTPEWQEWVDENGWDSAEQDLALQYMYSQFQDGGYNNIEAWLMEAKDAEVYKALDDFFVSVTPEPYVPSHLTGQLPEGWLSFWGDDDTVIGDWYAGWEKIFEENRTRTVNKHNWDDLENDFLADLEKQSWWNTKKSSYRDVAQLWYSGGGPGGRLVDGEWALGEGYYLPPEDADFFESMLGRDYEGTGDWKFTWDANKEVINSLLGDLIGEGVLESTDYIGGRTLTQHINNMAWMLMRDGGASNHYNPTATWADTAAAKIERYIIKEFFDAEGNLQTSTGVAEIGAGSIQDIVDQLRARANSQLYEVEGGDETLRRWALEIKSERGPNLAQRMAQIDNAAYARWGLSTEQIDGMGYWSDQGSPGESVSSLVHPLWSAATDFWDDKSYRKDDQWLMDNYQVVNEDGTKRFRTAAEMRNLARTNLDRSQHSSEYQDPMNEFLARAAAMFRSDY